MSEPGEETCDRCGESGHDRRTLWMACLYEMVELGIAFKQVELLHKSGRTAHFYTLYVCKDCRGSWMCAIQDWFNEKAVPRQVVGSGIFVREGGTEVEISLDEWKRRRAEGGVR